MAEAILCKICGKRRARRSCPAVHGDICTICCGTEREVSLSCPLTCEYLREAHRHEKPLEISEDELAYAEVQITEDFLREHEEFVLFSAYALYQAGTRTEGAIDSDLLAALEALIRTEQTLASGLVYETRPENFVAVGVQRSFQASLDEYRKERAERERLAPLKSSTVLVCLVFFYRLGQRNRNGRPKGRMFLDLLRQITPEVPLPETPSGIIV